MKTSSIAKLALGLTLLSVSSIALAGIATTKHNLGSLSAGGNTSAGTTEICVFCHTPHGADSSAAAPLWNRILSSNTYATYASLGTTTMDSASQSGSNVGGVSLACLSCHDGTQAMNTMLNAPGFGGYMGTVGALAEFNIMSDVVTVEPIAQTIYLSTDLRNDHPISIQYAGATTGAALDPDFRAATSTTVGGSGTVWFIEATGALGTPGATAAGKQKQDLPLYKATGGTLTGQPLVECATCHDPHTNTTTFLRNPNGNEGSATCLTCHDK